MNSKAIVFLSFAWVLSSQCASAESTNLLALYRAKSIPLQAFANPAASNRWDSITRPELVPVETTPLLSDSDFLSYNRNTHQFTISAEAARRLSGTLSSAYPRTLHRGQTIYAFDGPDTPFVLFASGKPIYLGWFSSPVSSTHYYNPMIWCDEFSITPAWKEPVKFRIRGWEDWSNSAERHPDVRSDKRLLNALKKLKL